MMRNIAIGLAAATIAIGGSTLSASALSGQESGISKGSMSRSYDEERGGGRVAGYKPDRFDEVSRSDRGDRISRLTPMQRERLRGIVRERYADLTPLQRERLRGIVRERYAELTPLQRERLRGIVRERFADLTPTQRARVRGFVRERLAELTPMQREHLRGIVRERYEQLTPLQRERLYRHGPFGRR
jgi:Protein of unknown function (DUF3106)